MELLVTGSFLKDLKKDLQLRKHFETAAERALSDPGLIREKTNMKGIYSLDLSGGRRALLAKDEGGSLVPFFVGSHADYDKVLARRPTPESVLTKVTSAEFRNVTGPLNQIGAAIGRKGGSGVGDFVSRLGRQGALVAGIVAGALSFVQSNDALAAIDHVAPYASQTVVTMGAPAVEAVLQEVDALPLGKAAANFMRPLVVAVAQNGEISSIALKGAAQNVLDRLGPPAIGPATHLERRSSRSAYISPNLEA